ncbi:Ankyrin repeat containing protein [Gracilaria domingensis]|nr:Ankyrin repeat containing protein [Gracilaria domingensis]
MSDVAEMEFQRIEHVMKSSPQNLNKWFHAEELDARVFFENFKKAPEEEESEKDAGKKTSKENDKLWTDTEDILGSTPLHLAVCMHEESPGILEEMLKLIKNDEEHRYLTPVYKLSSIGDLNWGKSDKDGFTLLALAVRKNDDDALRLLFRAGCRTGLRYSVSFEVESERKNIVTNLLGLTIVFDAMTCFLTLLELGVDPFKCDSRGKLPVHLAAEYGRLDALQKLLETMQDTKPSDRRVDSFLVREDFETIEAADMNTMEEDTSEEGSPASPDSNIDESREPESEGEQTDPNGMQHADEESQSNSGALWESRSMGSEDFDEDEEGEEESFTLEDILQLEREMIEAGFEVQRDRQGNITARFRGREDDSQIQTGRLDSDYGSNLLHLAVKGKQYDICHFLLTAAKSMQRVDDRRGDGMTAMHIAARSNDTRMMRLLMEEGGAHINPCNDLLGMYPIHLACETGASEALQFLLAHGANPNCRDDNDFVPLHYAATCEESSECINLLLDANANVNAVSLAMETPVYTAVSRWNIAQFWKILRAGGDPNIAHSDSTVVLGFLAANSLEELANFAHYLNENPSVKNTCNLDIVIGDNGQTALHIAAGHLHVNAVDQLLKAGADPNTEDEDGLSPLLTAMEQQESVSRINICTCMNLLLKAGADPNKIVPDRVRPLHFACNWKYHQLVEQLLECGAELDATSKSETALHIAAKVEDAHSMKLLLGAGANPNLVNEEKLTPLLHCAKHHFVEGVRVLAENGADMQISAAEGDTCMHVCADMRNGRVRDVIHILAEYGASVNAFNTIGDQPLHVHITEHRTEAVRSLIEAGADINGLSKSGRSPLMTACARGHLEAVRMLIRAGANVNLENKNQHTALFYFAGGSESKTVRALRLLISAGADINHKDKDGDTVLHEAALNDHAVLIRFLLHRGIDINVCNKAHETPLFQTAREGYVESTEALLRNYPTVRAANPKICDKSGTSPYEAARARSHTEVMQMLLQAMKVTLSTFAPLSVYAYNSPTTSGGLEAGTGPSVQSGKTICAICQEELELGDQIRRLPCGHEYHDPCILSWIGGEQMSQHMNCPICKQPIAPEIL